MGPWIAIVLVLALLLGSKWLVTGGVLAGLAVAGVLAVGTLWFWVLVPVSCILLCALVDNDEGSWATVTMLLTLVLLQVFGDIKVFSYVYNHPLVSMGMVAGYLAAGATWSVWKWYLHAKDQRRKYDEEKASFLKGNNITDNVIPAAMKSTFEARVSNIDVRSKVTEHKDRIIMWMTYWPWSALAWAFSDLVKRLFNEIYYRLRDTMQQISDRIWEGVENDLPSGTAVGRRRRNRD